MFIAPILVILGFFSPLQCIEIVSTSLVNGILNSQKGLILQT